MRAANFSWVYFEEISGFESIFFGHYKSYRKGRKEGCKYKQIFIFAL